MRRLVSKCLLDSCSDDAKNRLEPPQVGVGTKGGAEAIVHVTRQWFSRHGCDVNRVVVKLDMENAFNTMDREAMLVAIRSAFPHLAPWVDISYRVHTGLWLDGKRLESCRGVQQGGPSGLLIFSLALQVAIEIVKARSHAEAPGDLDFMAFYLDDGIVAGPGDVVLWYCKEL